MNLKAYVITIQDNKLSEASAQRTLKSAIDAGLDAEIYYGVDKYSSINELKTQNLNLKELNKKWIKYSYVEPALGCFLSHYFLWLKCAQGGERFVILEHDVEFTDKFVDIKSEPGAFSIMNIGKPLWGEKTNEHLAGAHAYIINSIQAKKLIKSAKNDGIIPTDVFISRDIVEIEDAKPYCCQQRQEFTMIQRDITNNKRYPKDCIPAHKAWNDGRGRVMVFLADEAMYDKIPPLIMNAKVDGLWDGDFIVVTPMDSDTTYLDDRMIESYMSPELHDTPIHFNKMFMFSTFFEEWDWILYVDLDVWFVNPISLSNIKNKNKLFAKRDNLSFISQFNGEAEERDKVGNAFENSGTGIEISDGYAKKHLTEEQQRVKDYLRNQLNYDASAFQTCFLYRHSSMNKEEFKELESSYFYFYVYLEIARAKHWDQAIFNQVFNKRWNIIGEDWIQTKVLDEVDWDLSKLDAGYSDSGDYQYTTCVHFTSFFPPWEKKNKRFYNEWLHYYEQDEI